MSIIYIFVESLRVINHFSGKFAANRLKNSNRKAGCRLLIWCRALNEPRNRLECACACVCVDATRRNNISRFNWTD